MLQISSNKTGKSGSALGCLGREEEGRKGGKEEWKAIQCSYDHHIFMGLEMSPSPPCRGDHRSAILSRGATLMCSPE